MKRRKFFKIATPLAASPLMLSSNPLSPLFKAQLFNSLDCEGLNDRILIVINLDGGNDGINTIVPTQQYDDYSNLRPTVALSDSGPNPIIPLDSNLPLAQQVSLHPQLSGIKDLYDAGKVNIIQGTGYAGGVNRSHFKGTELWHTGGDGTAAHFNKQNGWIGRYLEYSYPGNFGNPNGIMPDPPGMMFSGAGIAYQGINQYMAVRLAYISDFGYHRYDPANGIAAPTHFPNTGYGQKLLYMKNTQAAADVYSNRLESVFTVGTSTQTYIQSGFGRQMESIAQYISGGCKAKVYYASIGGFDHHGDQINGSPDGHVAPHGDILQDLFDNIKIFQDDMDTQGLADKVLMVTFSEFGRTRWENGINGTEHGTYGPMFVIGNAANAGMTGTNLDLSDVNLGGLQYDHRQVYTTLLQDWLGAADDVIHAAQMGDYLNQKIPIINSENIVSSECYVSNFVLPIELLSFTATLNAKNEVVLDWVTASEKDNSYFEVQRSQDGKTFNSIKKVNSKGDSSTRTSYQSLDKNPWMGISYYRLKQFDYLGKVSYSEIQSIKIVPKSIKNIKVYPNPAIYDANVVFTILKDSWMNIAIYNTQGILVEKDQFFAKTGFNKKSYNVQHLPKGMYVIKVEAQDLNYQTSLKLNVQ